MNIHDEIRLYDKVLELIPGNFYDDEDYPNDVLVDVMEGKGELPDKYKPYIEKAKKMLNLTP